MSGPRPMRRPAFIALAALLLLCLTAAVAWVRHDPGLAPSRDLRDTLESLVDSGAQSFDFAANTPFAWQRLYVFGPYSSRAVVEGALGFPWPDFGRSTIESSDSVYLVLFVRDQSVVSWYEQPRSVDLGWIANAEGYRPSEAKFGIDRSSGRPELTRWAATMPTSAK